MSAMACLEVRFKRSMIMNGYPCFIELPIFSAVREQYMDDDAFRSFQTLLIENPAAGDVIQGTGGLRKVRVADARRQKGKRGGLRVIYYFVTVDHEFLLFSLYDKDEQDNLAADAKKAIRQLLADYLELRRLQTCPPPNPSATLPPKSSTVSKRSRPKH